MDTSKRVGWKVHYLQENRGVFHPGYLLVYCKADCNEPVVQGDWIEFPGIKMMLPGKCTGYERCA